MAWNTPAAFSVGELVTAAKMNIMVDDLIYLKARADSIYSQGGFTSGIQTVLPASSYTESLLLFYQAWNETGNAAIGSPNFTARIPGGADLALSDAGPTNTITIKFPANGSVTVERSLGSVTWGVRLLLLFF